MWHVLYILMLYVSENVESVLTTFPVAGYSFLPPDLKSLKNYSEGLAQLEVFGDDIPAFLMTSPDKPQRILIRGEASHTTYFSEFKPLLKKGNSQANPDVLPNKVSVKAEKVKDARALLRKHFDDGWVSMENLVYYRRMLQEPEISDNSFVEEVEDGMTWEED
ncbi:hypothetical protein PR048_002396 [Dryococelus australis]|uniref:Uncharacterized protein n=1 Tax=Dryococelus australis TaxID=614101 RepID=A0ABQ9IK12_9NEOP|nr:hypothetical protein PR048_002396 [Dryococelus australis]